MSSFRCIIIGLLCLVTLASGIEPVTMAAGTCIAVTGLGAFLASCSVVPAAGIWGWLLPRKELDQFSFVLGLHRLANRTEPTIRTSKAWIHDDCSQRNIVCQHAWGNEHVLHQRGDSSRSLGPCALRHDFGRAMPQLRARSHIFLR